MVYIASPYTKGDHTDNACVQMDMADKLMSLGYCPIAPLLTHFQAIYKPRPYEDWMAICMEKVRRSDVVLRLPGESAGADREVAYALSHRIPVVYSLEDLKNIEQRLQPSDVLNKINPLDCKGLPLNATVGKTDTR